MSKTTFNIDSYLISILVFSANKFTNMNKTKPTMQHD